MAVYSSVNRYMTDIAQMDNKWLSLFVMALLQMLIASAMGQDGGLQKILRVKESAPKDTIVGSISDDSFLPPYYVMDSDQSMSSHVRKSFHVDMVTGVITTKRPLDRESVHEVTMYTLLVSSERSKVMHVIIFVDDINDHAPTFANNIASLRIELAESSPNNSKVTLGSVVDPDAGLNSIQRCDITDGNAASVFKLSTKHPRKSDTMLLDLVVNAVLDRETTPTYNLIVSCFDGGTPVPKVGQLNVTVILLDTNDLEPVFELSHYSASVLENTTVGTSILEVLAFDKDAGQNGNITYSIDYQRSESADAFSLHATSGILSVNKPLDYEKKNSYQLLIWATDHGREPLSGNALISVTVENINEQPPHINLIFLSGSNHTASVSENAELGDIVIRSSISDPDSPKGERVSVNVSLTGHHDHFQLSSLSSRADNVVFNIIVSQKLNREKISLYNMTISATDMAVPPLTSHVKFQLYVTDVNDNPPRFTQGVYTAEVVETDPPDTSVIQVTAEDTDVGLNGEVRYEIIEALSIQPDWFTIDSKIGLITTQSLVDCEVNSQPVLLIRAYDQGDSSMSSTATVRVTVRDVNDNQPMFDQSYYSVSVPENLTVDTCVLTVSASDPDCGVDAQVTYRIAENLGYSDPAEFTLNSRNGQICIKRHLDYETKKLYEFGIQAVDRDGLASTVMVKIHVVDINDNQPSFYPSSYKVNIKDNTAPRTPIVTVHAADPDSGSYGRVHYELVSGGSSGFEVNPDNGVISLSHSISRNVYSLHVSAIDGAGARSLINAMVIISVISQNEHPPVFDMTTYNLSVSETASPRTTVGTVTAHKPGTVPGDIRYSIMAGDPDDFFDIMNSGIIYTKHYIDHERHASLLLNIQAVVGDPPLFGMAQVNMTILDDNDNEPQFRILRLELPVREDAAINTVIYNVQAFDRDSGENGHVKYRLDTNPDNVFRLNRDTGKLQLRRELNYEHKRSYEFVVVAYDQGVQKTLSSNMTVVVSVQDVNDNEPVFTKSLYKFTINENTAIVTNNYFARVHAEDDDDGNNGRVFYQIVKTAHSSKFGILPSTGQLYVRDNLDAEVKQRYMLQVIAKDNGSPVKSATANIVIDVEDVNDNDPSFLESEYLFALPETQSVGVVVGQVSAEDQDITQRGNLYYSLSGHGGVFIINQYTGSILTNSSLDREVKGEYTFTATATDRGTPARSIDVSVRVNILDLNDNRPRFTHRPGFTASVHENRPKGTQVVQISATDTDADENGTVSYFLATDGDGINFFSIHSVSGRITTKEVLDYEAKRSYILHIVARDNGIQALESSLWLTVNVTDDNDGAPTFPSTRVSFLIDENVPIGTIVDKLYAYDRDSGERGRVSYYLVAGNVFGTFDVECNNGNIITARVVDYEESSAHSLVVTAVDNDVNNRRSSNIEVTINVLDLNDNAPLFDMDPIVLHIKESTRSGALVYTFHAEDRDTGVNGTINYSIESQSPGEYFNVNSVSGALRTSAILDYEQVQQVSLVVLARDASPLVRDRLESRVTVRIFVLDENDNAPVLEHWIDRYVFEDEPVGFPIMHIIANDADSNLNDSGNNVVRYRIDNGNEDRRFSLNSVSGLLSVLKALDREKKDVYLLNISAYDHGHPRLTSHRLLTIHVHDVNDNVPQFEEADYPGSIREHMDPMTSVMTIHATDQDIGPNGDLEYFIPAGIADDKFTINENTGVIRSAEELDREVKAAYILTVYVRDNGYPPHYNMTTVVINVTDMNDHTPEFRRSRVYLDVPENEPISVIHRMVASDADSGQNGDVTYTILSGDSDPPKFSINANTGDLSSGLLNREATHEYNLTIVASDGGNPPNSASCVVVVNVIDVNDNNPVFTKHTYTKSIPEDYPVGRRVLTVQATDADEGMNGNVTYSLGNDTDGLFSIDSNNGIIRTTGAFDREKKATYIFQVNATDGGLFGPRMGMALVIVTILDINDNSPIFTEPFRTVNVPENTGMGVTILTVKAVDKDEGVNKKITYSLVNEFKYFTISPQSGAISTRRELDREAIGLINLQVLATDKGRPPRNTTGIVEIRVGTGSTAQTIRFTNLTYAVNLPENSPRETIVTTVYAEFVDGRQGDPITYSFANGNEDRIFRINNQGKITVLDPSHLDYEQNQRLRLIIVASASGAYGYTTVWINLRDENDNAPRFAQDRYTSAVWEGQDVDTYVTQVIAADADSGDNSRVQYHIIDGNDDNQFTIDPAYTGIVRTRMVLDYEAIQSYRLTIEAADGGSPRKSSTCILRINVVNTNDNDPKFPPFPPIYVSEGTEIGTVITTVTANDADLSPALNYSFADDGNVGDMFSIDRFTGRITLARKLDYETTRQYRLKLKVSDTLHVAMTTLEVNVDDVNDNVPVFAKQMYHVTIPEQTQAGQSIFTVNATDEDSGKNGRLTYHMDIAPVDGFYINQRTGTIYTNRTVTYQPSDSTIQLVVTARDYGHPMLATTIAVRVQVRDINDHHPVFKSNIYRSHIREDRPRGTPVMNVTALDQDSARQNQNIDYDITAGNQHRKFLIDQKLGQIYLNGDLDRETVPSYIMTIMAKDRGIPAKSSTVSVTIIVDDFNDQAPAFRPTEYYIELNETFPNDVVFINVSSYDNDIGYNAEINYAITSGNDDGLFIINAITGHISVTPSQSLDYEQQPLHKLIVRATDCSRCARTEPRLSAFTMVVVNLTDVNEFAPTFPMKQCNIPVLENLPIGTSIYQVHANDNDAGPFGVVLYEISSESDVSHLFSIEPRTGVMRVLKVFDRESRDMDMTFIFQIIATDPAGLQGSVTALVFIENVDEFYPVFEQTEYNLTVPGNAKAGHVIGQVHATDLDNNFRKKISYSFRQLNSDGDRNIAYDYISVNRSTGVVFVKKDLQSMDDDLSRKKRFVSNMMSMSHSRIRRALRQSSLMLIIEANSGQLTSQTVVKLTVNRTCDGCGVMAVVDKSNSGGLEGVALIVVILCVILVVVLAVVIICLVLRWRHRKSAVPASHNNSSSMFDPLEITPPQPLPQANGYGVKYPPLSHSAHISANTTTSDISEQSHNSMSSGHGSGEEAEEEDEEIRMINANSELEAYSSLRGGMPDSGIQADDNVSNRSAQNHQEYLARLGIDTSRIQAKARAENVGKSVESMHQFSDEGGGEGDVAQDVVVAHVPLNRIGVIDTDDEAITRVPVLDTSVNTHEQNYYESEARPTGGSLSSVINSEEEYSGSYNWDYLLDWGPQYQPLAHVFTEIARLKDESSLPRKHNLQHVPPRQFIPNGVLPVHMEMSHVRTISPPIITSMPPMANHLNHIPHSPAHSSHSSRRSTGARSDTSSHKKSNRASSGRTSTINSLPSLPRSPVSYESSFTSPALTPSFTPSLSPLASRSPSLSPFISPQGLSGSETDAPLSRGPEHSSVLTLSGAESEQELRI